MRRVFPALILLTLGLLLAACSGDDSKDSGTGVPTVDAAIKAILASDAAELSEQAVLTTVACTTAEGLGGPPKCELGQDEGTQVTVLPAAYCEGSYIGPDGIAASMEGFVRGATTVHGVYRSGGVGDFFTADYIILLEVDDPELGVMAREVYLTDEGVTGLFFGCGHSVEDLIDSHGLTDELAYTH